MKSDSLLTRCKSHSELMHSFILNCHKLQHSNIHHTQKKDLQRLFSAAFPTALSRMTERVRAGGHWVQYRPYKQQHSSRERKRRPGNFANLQISSLCHLNAFPSELKTRLTYSPKMRIDFLRWRIETVYYSYYQGGGGGTNITKNYLSQGVQRGMVPCRKILTLFPY